MTRLQKTGVVRMPISKARLPGAVRKQHGLTSVTKNTRVQEDRPDPDRAGFLYRIS